MVYLRQLEGIVFYLSLFSISLQVGKHFWPSYAFVRGIRLDYLSPTLYLSDIFIISLLIFVLLQRPQKLWDSFSHTLLFPAFFLSVFLSSIFASNFEAAIVWCLRIVLAVFFGWYVGRYDFKKNFVLVVDTLMLAGIMQSSVAFLQFLFQRSLGGFMYFFGERSFTGETIGVATFFSNGRELLRPYGTFPHPNVLAFFLLIALILGMHFVLYQKSSRRTYGYIFSLIIIMLGLLVTGSRSVILVAIFLSGALFFRKKKQLIYVILTILIFAPLYLVSFSGRFFSIHSLTEAVDVRVDLIINTSELISQNILFGAGPNNTFFLSQGDTVPISVRFQPVHNMYLHAIAQLGLLGLVVMALFLKNIFVKLRYGFYQREQWIFPITLLLCGLFFVGFFDHFFITLPQGLLMSALLVGLLYNTSMVSE